MICFDEKTCGNFEKSNGKEWLITNGKGDFASSTVIGANTRKYHGLLVVSENPPVDRKLLLSKLEEEVIVDGGEDKFPLSTNKYPGVVHPRGLDYIKEFQLDTFPKFSYELPGVSIEKEIFLPFKENAVIVVYNVGLDSGIDAKIRIRPLVNNRGLREITHRSKGLPGFVQKSLKNKTRIFEGSSKSPFLLLGSDKMGYNPLEWDEEERWFKDMEYLREKERGYDYEKDHYNPGHFELDLSEGENKFHILAAGGPSAMEDFQMIYSKNPSDYNQEYVSTKSRLEELYQEFNSSVNVREDSFLEHLVWASDSFIANGDSIVAGYHWFEVWGRDSLIAFPGLTLVTGRFELAKEILKKILKTQQNGLIPNIVGGSRKNFESVDASLWFFHALYKYLSYTDDYDFAEGIWDDLEEIINSYIDGIEGKVQMDSDGLISTDPGQTWMDARIGETCVTPRDGKCVEINSLWYNALKIANAIGRNIGKDSNWSDLTKRVEDSFEKEFWNSEMGCLYDVVRQNSKDDSLRPNQIFALSLPFQLLDLDKGRKVISTVQSKLLTPYGLRSLAEDNEEYIGSYEGNLESRDRSYHQGTVWGWLIGPFVTAITKLPVKSEKEDYAMDILRRLLNEHLREAGLGTVSEIFDGDYPHTPRGCISQAWSVAELLRCYVEDVEGNRPPYESSLRGIK